jgi:hypothetical protein
VGASRPERAAELNVEATDRMNVERATRYLELLGEEEVRRRAALDYAESYGLPRVTSVRATTAVSSNARSDHLRR